MDAIKLTVRCMAWPEGEVWVAACIDLTLPKAVALELPNAVQSPTCSIKSHPSKWSGKRWRP